jgi:ketosteroid isomerase-like protein
MKRIALAALLILSALPLLAASPDDTELRAALTNYRQALVKKDFAVLEKIWTDDYTFIDAHGHLRTKAERLADLHSAATSLDSIRHEEQPVVHLHGDIGIVMSTVTLVGRYGGKEVSGEFRSTHIWAHRDGRWQLLMNQLTAIK